MEKQMNGDDEYSEKVSGMEPQQNQETKDPKNGTTPTKLPLANTPTSPPPPSPTTLNNNTPTPTTPYLTSQSHPQPWPNEKHNKHHFDTHTPAGTTTRWRPQPWPNKRHNKHHYGTRTPTGTTAKRRPPPWPILPTPTPILSIGSLRPPPWPNIRHHRCRQYSPVSYAPPARPPPWPIIPHGIHPTSQNRWNAKWRIKARSRNISDEVSFWFYSTHLLSLTIIIQIRVHYHTLLYHHTYHHSPPVSFLSLVLLCVGTHRNTHSTFLIFLEGGTCGCATFGICHLRLYSHSLR